MSVLLKRIACWWRIYVLILTPLLLLPIPLANPSSVSKCAFVMLLMAVYWVTEALPLGVTALIPIILCPTMGLMPSKDIAPNYMKDTCMLFLGGLIIASAVEKWNVHKRIAMRVLLIVGTKPKWLMLGFMLPTWFLSMWVSNTATTPMMVSIVMAVLEQMKNTKFKHPNEEGSKEEMPMISLDEDCEVAFQMNSSNDTNNKSLKREFETEENSVVQPQAGKSLFQGTDDSFQKMSKAMLLSICFAANVGGIATLTGTPPNLVLKGLLDMKFPGKSGINFTSWMVFGLPLSVLNLIICWLWLQVLYMGAARTFCGKGDSEDEQVKEIIRREYNQLGRMQWPEISSLLLFIVTALLWLTREPDFMPGWASLFKEGYVTDATAGILISVVLFMFPSKRPSCGTMETPGPLLDWQSANSKIPWHILLLLGGGFALADVSKASGFSKWVGTLLSGLQTLAPSLSVFIITITVAIFTNFFSNTATATLMLPILADLAVIVQVNPLYLMLPATVAASFAFMLPVATPPNAIVYASGHITIKDMVIAGSLMNIICIFTVSFAINTYGYAFFNLGTYPSWAGMPQNSTALPLMENTTVGL